MTCVYTHNHKYSIQQSEKMTFQFPADSGKVK